jgi:hydroxymethylglutaryl-CoA lyase
MKRLAIQKLATIRDTTVREGFQREERLIPTSAKLWVVERLILAGFKRLEVTNFANPKRLPQFADAEELLRQVHSQRLIAHLLGGVELSAVAINRMAVDRAVAARQMGHGPDRILMLVSVSEAYQQANSGMGIEEYWKMAETCIWKAMNNGIKVCGAVNSIWGCPKAGPMDTKKAVAFAERWLQIGAQDIEHADHDGSATPDKVYDYFSRVLDAMPDPGRHVAHFHSTRGWGSANVLAALQAGITQFEATMGGLGGQPANFVDGVPVAGTGDYYHKDPGISGLVSTEDLAVMLDEMGIQTGLDVDAVLKIGAVVERIVGRRLRSECVHTGRIPKTLKASTQHGCQPASC